MEMWHQSKVKATGITIYEEKEKITTGSDAVK